MAPIKPNPTLSDDLISEILKRVPVKSLLCFKSVCKTWLSLIKHPAFVKSQLRHAIATQTDQTIIAHETFSLLDVNSREIVAHLTFPHPPGVLDITLVGSANGIVCVAVQYMDKINNLDIWKTDIYLWNPAIRQSKLILIPSFINSSDDMISVSVSILGFGYDGVDDDFKVATLVILYPSSNIHYEVYSNNRNAWRDVHVSAEPRQFDFDVCINGFLCGRGKDCGLVAFDLNKEVLNFDINLPVIDDVSIQQLLNCAVKLPLINDAHTNDDDDDYDYDDVTRIIEFNNSVAVIMLMDSNEKINMWTLDNDVCLRGSGVEALWTPILSIDLDMSSSLIHGYFSNGNLILVLLLGDIINDVKMLISCNAEKKEAKITPLLVEMANIYCDRVICKYTESLVSLAGFRNVN